MMLVMGGRTRISSVAVAVVVAVVAAGCTRSSGNATVDTTTRPSADFSPIGLTVLGRISGTFMAVGGPTNGHYPLAGQVVIRPAAQQGPIAPATSIQITVGADGSFSKMLGPGTFDVTGTSPQFNGGHTVCRATKYPVTVTSGQHVVVNVVCQMK